MPGEKSKRIGEIGESTAFDFLNLIGWSNVIKNFDIDCVNKEKHNSKMGTHGIDGYFHYESPMISNTLENILISVKFSSKEYENSIVLPFKKDFKALTSAIECFKNSSIRNQTNNSYSNIDAVFDRGVLFKINNVDDSESNIINKLINIEVPTDNKHDGVILIDNHRINFLSNCISYVKTRYDKDDDEVRFFYFNTGLNNNNESIRKGTILPYQYLSSDIIPFRVQNKNEVIFILCYKGAFSEEGFLKLVGIAKNSGSNLQSKIIIAFPDYNELSHELAVANVKQSFKEEKNFADTIEVISYNRTFRR